MRPTRGAVGSRRGRGGLSLLEMLGVVTLTLVVLGAAVLAFRHFREGNATYEAARQLKADFEWARTHALSTGEPAGVVVTSPYTYEVRAGAGTRPRVVRQVNLYLGQGRSPKLFVGWWDTAKNRTTITPPAISANLGNVAMSTWGGSGSDYAFMYAPTGVLRTNNLPSFGDSYHVAVTEAVAYHEETPPGTPADGLGKPPYYKVDKIWSPTYTVSASILGEVSFASGLEDWTGAIITAAQEREPEDPSPSPSPSADAGANGAPSIGSVTIRPVPDATPAAIRVEDTVEVDVSATDPEDDSLHYAWTCSGGTLSATNTKSVSWTAPSSAGTATLTVRVDDGRGQSSTKSTSFLVTAPGKFLAIAQWDYRVFEFNDEGKEVWEYGSTDDVPGGSGEFGAWRLPNGNTLMWETRSNDHRLHEVTPGKSDVYNVRIENYTPRAMDLLPNGHFLRICNGVYFEWDPAVKHPEAYALAPPQYSPLNPPLNWRQDTIDFMMHLAVHRLPSGNTLLATWSRSTWDQTTFQCRHRHAALELDTSGQLVWSYEYPVVTGFFGWDPNFMDAQRLANGNTVIVVRSEFFSSIEGVRVVSPAGTVVARLGLGAVRVAPDGNSFYLMNGAWLFTYSASGAELARKRLQFLGPEFAIGLPRSLELIR